MDSARELKGAHVPKEEAQRVMVLLLAKLFEYSSAPVEWVRKGLCLQVDSLPASVRELLIDR